MRFNTIICVITILLFCSCTKKTVITTESLLDEMVDREALARFPDPSFNLKQFSSYDRATIRPGDPSWFANEDRTMFIRAEEKAERTEHVMFEADGPGAIVRFWMTFAGKNSGHGILRIYFDRQTKPAIEGSAFDVLSGRLLTGEPLASSVSDSTKYEMRGHNLYLPLPYSSHCKITYESDNIKDAGAKTGGEAVYYNIDYRTYSSDVKVVSFSFDELSKASVTLARVQELLRTRDRGLNKIMTETFNLSGKIEAGNSISKKLNGSQAIRMIKLKLNPSVNPQALRSTILEIVFDGERTVWCPLGDFFGTGYQLRYSNTWYSSVDTNGTLSAYWVMPYKESAEIRIRNTGTEALEILDSEILTAPWKWDENSMHFGTSWHQFTNLRTGRVNNNGDEEPFDVNFIELSGKGVYVGDALTVFNTAYAWWGEGDEKIYVNGEIFPSHIGTGTEDYYGYAWCRPEKFANHPFIAQPDGSGNFNPGYTVNVRYRGLDGIPFTSSLKFDMEMWHWDRGTIINYAPVTYWYTLPGGKSTIMADSEGAEVPVALKRSDLFSPDIKNERIEGENMILSSVTSGDFSYQSAKGFGWSENTQIFWKGGKKGDTLELSFFSPNSIESIVKAQFTKAPDYGSIRAYFNGKPIPQEINLYNKTVTTTEINLGKQLLKKGENKIRVEITKPSPIAGKAFFGLDYLSFNK